MSATQRFVLVLVGMVLVSLTVMKLAPAQSGAAKTGGGTLAGRGASAGQVMDVTPVGQIAPRVYLVFDFERQTMTLVNVDLEADDASKYVSVMAIRSLTQVSPEWRNRPK
jgi:hypothetical protein